jgi:putative addiction module antidote
MLMATVIETKLITVGDSISLLLPKEVLAELNLKQDDKVLLVKNGKGYRIAPYDENVQEALDVAKDIIKRYPNTFRELAK